jgi:hypothetical protein
VPRAELVHDDLGGRVGAGDVAHAARVVEVDVRHDDGREVVGADAVLRKRLADDWRRTRGPRLDERRGVAEDR